MAQRQFNMCHEKRNLLATYAVRTVINDINIVAATRCTRDLFECDASPCVCVYVCGSSPDHAHLRRIWGALRICWLRFSLAEKKETRKTTNRSSQKLGMGGGCWFSADLCLTRRFSSEQANVAEYNPPAQPTVFLGKNQNLKNWLQ